MNRWMGGVVGLLVLAGISGCSTSARIWTDDVVTKGALRSVAAESVKVYSSKDIGRKYDIIGLVIVSEDAGENAEGVMESLREEASELGADAIVDARMSFEMGYWSNGLTVSGVAVKLK